MISFTTNFNTWIREMNLAGAKINTASGKVQEEVAHLIYKQTINWTPVGDPSLWKYPAPKNYKPGTLKASWAIDKNGKEFTISNSQPYAERVEYGWSTQAPNGMLRRAIALYPSFIEQSSRKYKV